MQKIESFYEVLNSLKQGDVLTSNGKDFFVFKNDKVHHYNDGTRYRLCIEDFTELFKKHKFYLYEEKAEIDESKDEAYYRYYKK